MMMEEHDSKRIRRINANDSDSVVVDRISALPDCILADILSFLPTKQAISTSLLSKRWKFSWLDLHNLHFEFIDLYDTRNTAFIRFVTRALLLFGCSRPLNKFSLVWDTHGIISHIMCWIDAAIIRNVNEINLSVDDPNLRNDLFEFPITGFNCDSLRSLQLRGIAFVYHTSAVCLPRLETLILDVARFRSKQAFDKLINGCPMLHYFELRVYPNYYDDDEDDAEEDFMYLVSSPSLRHLDIYTELRCSLKLDAPSLEYLSLHGPIAEIFVEKSLSSLNQAFFSIVDEHHLLLSDEHDLPSDSFVEAVRAIEHAKFLTLSAYVMRALNHGGIKPSTKFDSLVNLETTIFRCDWRSLQDLIQCSDNLQLLTITQGPKLRGNNDRTRLKKQTTPVEVPRCLSTSLKKIVFNCYHGSDADEEEMIRYLLTNANVLEMMHITCAGKMNTSMFKSVQKIDEYRRKSPICVVKVSGFTPNNNNVEVCFTARPLT